MRSRSVVELRGGARYTVDLLAADGEILVSSTCVGDHFAFGDARSALATR